MPASVSLPPRHTQSHWEALASDSLPLSDRLLIAALVGTGMAGVVGFCLTLAGV